MFEMDCGLMVKIIFLYEQDQVRLSMYDPHHIRKNSERFWIFNRINFYFLSLSLSAQTEQTQEPALPARRIADTAISLCKSVIYFQLDGSLSDTDSLYATERSGVSLHRAALCSPPDCLELSSAQAFLAILKLEPLPV